jgi:hypothetical protein
MPWFKKKRRLKIAPIALATMLHETIALKENSQLDPETYAIPDMYHGRFREKTFVYREANILLAFAIKCSQDELYREPLREYERIIFSDTPTGARFRSVKAATDDLFVILDPNNQRNARWSHNWFSDIGHEETDPITLGLFPIFWIDQHIAIRKRLAEMTL